MDQLRALLERYAHPCAEDCEHSQCPLLRELHAIVIEDTLERARLTVKPLVDREREGEFMGDLMDMRLDTTPSPPSSPDHYFIVTQTRDKCGYSGCELGPLGHPEIPEHNFPTATPATPVVEHERVQLLRMCLQQFEFMYGKGKRGWDAVFLMERLRDVIASNNDEVKEQHVN